MFEKKSDIWAKVFYQDIEKRLRQARSEGRCEGHREGRREGYREGRSEGHREGRREGRRALMEALCLLGKRDETSGAVTLTLNFPPDAAAYLLDDLDETRV